MNKLLIGLLFAPVCCHRLTDNPSPRALQIFGYSSWHLPATTAGSHTARSSRPLGTSRLCVSVSVCWELNCPCSLILCSSTCLWECLLSLLVSLFTANQTAGQGARVRVCVYVHVSVRETDNINLWSVTFFHFLKYYYFLHNLKLFFVLLNFLGVNSSQRKLRNSGRVGTRCFPMLFSLARFT